MKDLKKMVGKYYCINDKYYARYFEGTSERRFRSDDQEWVYWTQYSRVGGGQIEDGRIDTSILRGDHVTDSAYSRVKSSRFKTIRKHEWMEGLIMTVFSPNFVGIEGNFLDLLDEI